MRAGALGLPTGMAGATAECRRLVGDLDLKRHATISGNAPSDARVEAILQAIEGTSKQA